MISPQEELGSYIEARVTVLAGTKTLQQIANEVGYDNPNMIRLFMLGQTKVPLGIIVSLARAIHGDETHVLRLALEQFWPDIAEVIFKNANCARLSSNEVEWLKWFRSSSQGADPKLDEQLKAAMSPSRKSSSSIGIEPDPVGEASLDSAGQRDLGFKLDASFHQKFKMAAVMNGMTMKQLLEECFSVWVASKTSG